jgi:Co/Zn/Cd efflux system component
MSDATEATGRRRTRGLAALIEGVFAALWFTWGQGSAPSRLARPIFIASVVSLLVAAAGLVMIVRSRREATALEDDEARHRYNVIVGLELGALVAGAALFGVLGLTRWIAAWVCLVVGAHFIPLANVFRGLHLVLTGSVIIAVGAATVVVGWTTSEAPSTIAGLGTGTCLLIAAIATLLRP